MIVVRFTNGLHEHPVAFMDDVLYKELWPVIEKIAKSKGYEISESEIEDTTLEILEENVRC